MATVPSQLVTASIFMTDQLSTRAVCNAKPTHIYACLAFTTSTKSLMHYPFLQGSLNS